jgi:hypothetical protein
MNKPKSTPGPWRVRKGTTQVFAGAEFVAGNIQSEGDARLISHAPTLLEEGDALVAWLREFVGADAWREIVETHPAPAVVNFIATLDRAAGRS